MYQVFAIVMIFILLAFVFNAGRKQGITFLVDQGKIMFILWIVALILYNLRISTLYSPNIQINLVVGVIVLTFFVLSKRVYLKEEDVNYMFDNFKDKNYYKIYSILTDIIFIIAALTFIYNAYKHGLGILEANKTDKQIIDHYAGYIVYMLVLVAEIKYVLFRKFKGIKDLIVLIGSIIILTLTLNRGPIAFLFVTIGIYEVFNFINLKEKLSRKQKYITYGILLFLVVAFIWFFGFIGNMRTEYVFEEIYNTDLWKHYGVNKMIPSGLVWIFLYLTSPLENVAFSLANQVVNFTYFNNLFYPFIKFGAILVGKNEEYTAWLMSRATYIPHLEETAGLNASSFIPQAFQDFGILGFLVYLAIYLLIAYGSIKLIKSKRNITPITKLLIYTNTLSLLLWSIFDNSFRISMLLINIMLLICIEFGYKKWTQWRIK